MATSVIMPALEMAQESGVLVGWLKREGEPVARGEPLMEIETDKVTVEIEAPASGVLGGVRAKEGDVVPVGQTIAWILADGEPPPASAPIEAASGRAVTTSRQTESRPDASVEISPLARKIAREHGIDPALIKPNGRRIEKADVLAYVNETGQTQLRPAPDRSAGISPARLSPASPKARRLASERGIDITLLKGSGPDGAVLAADVPLEAETLSSSVSLESPGTVWRVMAERMSQSWSTVPHFYLAREVDASQLMRWRTRVSPTVEKRSGVKPTFTDLLVKLLGVTLRDHPRVNASWSNGNIQLNPDIHIGLAVAVEDGLMVPVIRNADRLTLSEIAARRRDLVERAQSRKLRPADISEGTFTVSNLGMYGVDAFNAIVNPPQAAILAVGKIAERVVPLDGQIVIRPMMVMTLSCDHRVVDGARAAQFLDDLASLIGDPWRLLA